MRIFERLSLEDIKKLLQIIGQSIMGILDVEEIDKYNLDVDREYDQVEVEFFQWDRCLQILCTFVGKDVYVEFWDIENVSAEDMEKIEQAIIKAYGEILVLIQ